ncbi:oligosaccharide flippase family protein [Pontibacillus yanchengensis]|uniref:Oligosaccharide flippase family protein n=2 Tax=Pontibacillus yanchengensis TaxID=462910 RepID=A0ACC7VGJ5_9BACI|nr:lipid II flippase MurJ [Pontibacillus yanchengensis]MYL34259.1 oligosaccharide flippase family protein [Pontibacillus yanchengensis]MYL53730.1 oligosaccharide flippase family protein [Pontibacillus yanchengensis]
MSRLKQTAIWITLLSIFLKLLGFVRESMIAREFGVSNETDAFMIAFTFVTLILALIANGFNSAFLPKYVEKRKENIEEAERNANGVLNYTTLFFLGISVVAYFFTPSIVEFLFGSRSEETLQITVDLTRVFFIFMVVIALSGVLESYLQARRIFVPTQLSKIMGTLMATLFIIFFADMWGIYSVAYGFVFGTFLGVCIQFGSLMYGGFKWMPKFKLDDEFGRKLMLLLAPALLHSSVGHINVFVNKMFANRIETGAVTYLNNASLIMSIPSTIFTTTIVAIIFTLLSEQADNKEKFRETLYMGYQIGMMTLLPIAIGTLLVGKAVIAFIYEGGEFTAQDTANTYFVLQLYIPIILTQGLLVIGVKGMYAQGAAKRLLKISSTTILLNAALNWLFIQPLGYPGLALSSSVVALYYVTATTLAVYRDYDHSELKKLVQLFFRVLVPSIIMAVPIVLIQQFTSIESLYALWRLLILVPIGVVFYVAGMYLFYREGFRQMLRVVKDRKSMS